MSNFTYIPFTSIDFAGNPSLSSYALDATPLTFVPDLSNIENARVLWSFGDGTTSTAITARKTYHEAGTYNVNLVVYDCFSKAQISTTSQTYEIKNFIDETFTIELSSNEWKNGQINGPISIKSYTPINTKPTNIFYTVNDSNSINYELIKNDKFAHLSPTYQFYDKIYNFAIRSQQYSPINLISFEEYDTIYAKISSNEVVICDKQDIDAFTVGLSSEKVVYFKDDSISDKITIDFFLDQKNSNINNLNVTLSASIIENDDVNRLSITSNGIDGEFYSISSFDIDSIKFYDAWIPFVIKIKDNLNHSVKNFQISGFTVDLLSSNISLDSSHYTLSTFNMDDGYFYGGVRFHSQDNPIENIQIFATENLTNDQGTVYSLSGYSSNFDVFPSNFTVFQKINEDFDMTETIKSLRFQETLLDKKVLFDDFIRSIFGDINSTPETLGKKIHEKVSNFFQNHYDIDRCEVTALISLMNMMGLDANSYESSLLKYPETIKRMVNLLSIKNSKLFGSENKFAENFNPRGRTSKDEFGKNLGDQIDTKTYMLTAGIPIVSYEKFSKEYAIQQPFPMVLIQSYTIPPTGEGYYLQPINLSTYLQPLSTIFTYPLSGFNVSWGWGLLLPDNFMYDDIEKFYEFYEYIPTFAGNVVGNTITNEDGEDFNNRIRDVLYQSLDINS